jgi:vacuolar-type H+-ATPase subunit H
MDTKTALDQVAAAEAQVREMVEKAKIEAQNLLADTRRKQIRLMEDAERTARDEAEKMRTNAERELEKEISALATTTRQEIDAIHARAAGRMRRALDFIKSKLE